MSKRNMHDGDYWISMLQRNLPGYECKSSVFNRSPPQDDTGEQYLAYLRELAHCSVSIHLKMINEDLFNLQVITRDLCSIEPNMIVIT